MSFYSMQIMGQVFEDLAVRVKSDFLSGNGEPHYEGEVFCYESVYTASERIIGALAIDAKVQFLQEILGERLGEGRGAGLEMQEWIFDEETPTTIIDNLMTRILEVEIRATDAEIATEEARRYVAFDEAYESRHGVFPQQ
jgi:hypothetical protein